MKSHKWQIGQKVKVIEVNPKGPIKIGSFYKIIDIRPSNCACKGLEFLISFDIEVLYPNLDCINCGQSNLNIESQSIWFSETLFVSRNTKNKDKKVPEPLNYKFIRAGVSIGELKKYTLLSHDDFNRTINRSGFSNPEFIINELEANRLKLHYINDFKTIHSNKIYRKHKEIGITKNGSPIIYTPTNGGV